MMANKLAELVSRSQKEFQWDHLNPQSFEKSEVPVDEALVLIGSMASVVFNAHTELVFCNVADPGVKPHIHTLLDNGEMHDPGVTRFRLLKWFMALNEFFGYLSKVSLGDFACACTSKGRTSVGASSYTPQPRGTPQARPGASALNTWLCTLLRSTLDFHKSRSSLLSQCQNLVEEEDAINQDIAAISDEYAETSQKLAESPGIQAIQEEIEKAEKAINESKAQLETLIKEVAHLQEQGKQANEEHLRQTKILASADEQLRVLHDVLSNLKQQVVENPEALRQKCKAAEGDYHTFDNSLRQALERTSQLRAVQNINQLVKPTILQLAHSVDEIRDAMGDYEMINDELDRELRAVKDVETQLRNQRHAQDTQGKQLETRRIAKQQELDLVLQQDSDLRHQTAQWQREESSVEASIAQMDHEIKEMYQTDESEELRCKKLMARVDHVLRENSGCGVHEDSSSGLIGPSCKEAASLFDISARITQLLQSFDVANTTR